MIEHIKARNVEHVYKVALDFLKNFCGFLSTDGYVAYSIFDDAEKHPEVIHIGCWTHARRKWIEALPSDERAREIINLIAELFKIEVTFKVLRLKPFPIEKRREKRSKAILNKIHSKVLLMSLDVGLMANEMMKKAVTYTLNQWKFSVTESCSLNGINPESYLEDVFRSILFGTDRDKRDFLPCYYQAHELPQMNALEVAKLLSTAA